MDLELKKLVKEAIKNELGEIVSQEIAIRWKPFLNVQTEVLKGIDALREQSRTDRKDINTLLIGQATGNKQNKVIIDNQNEQETKIVEAVEKATEDFKPTVQKSVEKMFENKPFLFRLKKRFGIK